MERNSNFLKKKKKRFGNYLGLWRKEEGAAASVLEKVETGELELERLDLRKCILGDVGREVEGRVGKERIEEVDVGHPPPEGLVVLGTDGLDGSPFAVGWRDYDGARYHRYLPPSTHFRFNIVVSRD